MKKGKENPFSLTHSRVTDVFAFIVVHSAASFLKFNVTLSLFINPSSIKKGVSLQMSLMVSNRKFASSLKFSDEITLNPFLILYN